MKFVDFCLKTALALQVAQPLRGNVDGIHHWMLCPPTAFGSLHPRHGKILNSFKLDSSILGLSRTHWNLKFSDFKKATSRNRTSRQERQNIYFSVKRAEEKKMEKEQGILLGRGITVQLLHW